MNLRNALLCIDCDEVFTIEESPGKFQCPSCASSVFMPISAWVQTWKAFEREKGNARRGTQDDVSIRRRKMEIIRSTSIAA